MQNIKGVVVGNRTAGMTQLLVTYTTHVLQEEQVLNTFGDCRVSVTVDDKTVNFTVCDPTAGQEEYDRLRPIAYLQTDVFIICFSLVDQLSFENVHRKWYTEANHYCPDAPIILVGTELHLKNDKETIDEMRDRKLSPITYEQGLQMMKKIGAVKYLECSAKTHVGVQEVFDEAIRAVIHPTPIKKTDKRTSSNNAACTML